MSTIITNGRLSVTKDMIFGWCVYTEDDDGVLGWMPVSQLDQDTLRAVKEAADGLIAADDFHAELRKRLNP